jgi:hypothetical protein
MVQVLIQWTSLPAIYSGYGWSAMPAGQQHKLDTLSLNISCSQRQMIDASVF